MTDVLLSLVLSTSRVMLSSVTQFPLRTRHGRHHKVGEGSIRSSGCPLYTVTVGLPANGPVYLAGTVRSVDSTFETNSAAQQFAVPPDTARCLHTQQHSRVPCSRRRELPSLLSDDGTEATGSFSTQPLLTMPANPSDLLLRACLYRWILGHHRKPFLQAGMRRNGPG